MAKLTRKAGTTSQTLNIFIQDSSSTTGAGLTGLAYNTAGLVAYYVRPAGSATAITLATQTTTGSWSSGGFVEVSSANMPGVYRFDIPNACLAAGADSVVVILRGATNMAPLPLEIDLNGQVSIDSDSIAASAANKIADHVRRRTQANVEASSDGDALSVGSEYGMIQQCQESNVVDNAGYLTVYKTDGTTELAQRAITTDADAEPVTGIS